MTKFRITRTVTRKETVEIEANDAFDALGLAQRVRDTWQLKSQVVGDMDIFDLERQRPCGVYLVREPEETPVYEAGGKLVGYTRPL